MEDKLSISKINEYKNNSRVFFANHDFKSDAAMTIFDKNFDKKISKSEYNAVPKGQYYSYLNQLSIEINDKTEFYDYENLSEFLDDGMISFEELDGFVKKYGLKDFDEVKNLKDVSQMSNEEIIQELSQYNIKYSEEDDLKELLNNVREEISAYDKNSNVVDGHIGTFVQNRENNMCTVLSVLETMSDEQIKQMYKQKVDENGKIYYEVTFPQDKNTNKNVIVTQEEINNMSIKISQENGKELEVLGFSTGDADITMLEMAYIKRFGTDTFDNGSDIEISRRKFSEKDNKPIIRNTNLEKIDNFDNLPQNTTISLLYINEILEKGIDSLVLSDGRSLKFADGGLKLSDGTEIHGNHAMSVRGFDKEKQELIVSGNSFNSSTELRIPKELLKFFAMSLPEDFS